MSILRNLEAKLEGLFEGAFNRTFKSKVQPVEIARKLAKEMQDNKTVSISRTYVPNQYIVYLSAEDRSQFEGYEDGVKKELSDYLLENARAEGLALLTRPTVDFETDERLSLGEFGIQAMLVRPPEEGGRPAGECWGAPARGGARPPAASRTPRTSGTRWSTRSIARRAAWTRPRRTAAARCSWAAASAPSCREGA